MAGLQSIGGIVRDFAHAQRHLRKSPGFTVLAVLVLALGIGANTAVFSVVSAVLFKPLPYHEPDRIVTLTSSWPHKGTELPLVALPDFVDWRAGSRAYSTMAYYRTSERAVLLGNVAYYAQVTRVSPEFFRVFDVVPTLGRLFHAEDGARPNVAVVSYEFWQTRLGSNADVLNQTIRVQGTVASIVGVLPRGFAFPDATEVWQLSDTIGRENAEPRTSLGYLAIARLNQSATVESAQSEMTVIAQRLERSYPTSNEDRRVVVSRLQDHLTGGVRVTLFTLLGAVGVVLLMACANVATVLLARGTARGRELAIRTALGASRGRLIRQLLTENLLLALIAGAVGTAIGYAGSRTLLAFAPSTIPRISEVNLNAGVLAFALVISVLTTVVFGLAPALQVSGVEAIEALNRGGGRTGTAARLGRLPGALVVGEIALSMVLLTAAGLLIRSFLALNAVELGFKPERVLVMEVRVPPAGGQAPRIYRELLADIARLPGVKAAGASLGIPGHVESAGSYWIDHLPTDAKVNPFDAVYSVVTPGALAALNIPIKSGRDVLPTDTAEAPKTALVNDALVEKAFAGRNPIGRTIYTGFDSQDPMTIVGVVGNVRQWDPTTPAAPEVFMPYEQHSAGAGPGLRILVKTTDRPEALESVLRSRIREKSPDIPVRFSTMEQVLSAYGDAPRFRTIVVTSLGILALCLAIAGVYGVMMYIVRQRTAEIGVRMAVGASTSSILWMVIRQYAVLAIAGIVLGIAGSIAVSRLFSSLLFEIRSYDPLTYAAGIVVLGIVTFLACYAPASRAARVDPLVALRPD